MVHVQSLVRARVGGNRSMFLFHTDVSLSLPAHPLSLKSINISSGED